jgi:hypothetical protein
MLLAITSDKERIKPTKSVAAVCPVCLNPVVSKMGIQKLHHWAHKPNSDCSYGRGMTAWHYRWIDRHYQKPGWEIEYVNGNRRYDCFNKEKRLVIEVQKSPLYEYIIDKTREVTSQGNRINWILHQDMLSSLTSSDTCFMARSRRRLVVLDILQELSDIDRANFFVDSLANRDRGRSSNGLLQLHPVSKKLATYNDYYDVPFTKHHKDT